MPFQNQNKPFLYISNYIDFESTRAIIMLPDIFSFNQANLDILELFSTEFNLPSFGIDYFYELTKTTNALDYTQNNDEIIMLMNKMKGKDFLNIFNQSIELILERNPKIEELIVVGFCFGGRLAFLSGVNHKVSKIISFYGSKSNDKVFCEGKSAIESLIESRLNNDALDILAFYGDLDASISDQDRSQTKDKILKSKISTYKDIVYPNAGHAFFAKQRTSYNEEAYNQSLEEMKNFIK